MTQRRKRNLDWIWWVVFLVLIVIAVVVVVLVKQNYFDNKVNDSVPEISDTEDVAEKDDDVIKEEDEKEEIEVKKEEIVQYDGDDPNTSEQLTGAITYAGVNGNSLMIRVNIDQLLMSGTCELTLKDGEDVVFSGSVGIVGSAMTSTCEGFDVSMKNLPGLSGKNVQVGIVLKSGDKVGKLEGTVSL